MDELMNRTGLAFKVFLMRAARKLTAELGADAIRRLSFKDKAQMQLTLLAALLQGKLRELGFQETLFGTKTYAVCGFKFKSGTNSTNSSNDSQTLFASVCND